ncbi:protein translocase subunit [Naganishia albida]|nr:protein translocase subunit [Naganishia albida]
MRRTALVTSAVRSRVQFSPSLTSSLFYPSAAAGFHTSPYLRNGQGSQLPQSPFKVFVQTLKEELQKNRELQDNVKQLQGDVDKLADSEAMKKAREAYEKARLRSSLENNPRLKAAADEMKKAGLKISDGVAEAMKAVEESELMRNIAKASAAVSSGVSSATAPVRNTEAYKALAESVTEVLEESSRYGGYEEKEERRRRREIRRQKAGLEGRKRMAANAEAGEALVLSDKQEKESWTEKLKQNPRVADWIDRYQESESPLVSTVRSVTSTVGGWFDENETAKVIRMIRALDPDFKMDTFQKELREYIIPEVVDAYLGADKETLKMWCGEATYNVLWATMSQYVKKGLVSDSKVLDIRQVEISQGKILENDIPVFLVTFATQEVLCFRNAKSGEVVVGNPTAVEQCRYAAVLKLEESELDNPETGGWKIVEMARRGSRGYM